MGCGWRERAAPEHHDDAERAEEEEGAHAVQNEGSVVVVVNEAVEQPCYAD